MFFKTQKKKTGTAAKTVKKSKTKPVAVEPIPVPISYELVPTKPDSQQFNLALDKGQTIYTVDTWINDYQGNIQYQTNTLMLQNPFAIRRIMLNSAESITYGELPLISLSSSSSTNNNITLAPYFIGDIIKVKISKNTIQLLYPSSIVCFTKNIKINNDIDLKLPMYGKIGILLYNATLQGDEEYGYLWLSACGKINVIELKENEKFTVAMNKLLICSGNAKYVKMQNKLNQEIVYITFTGPCSILTHHNGDKFKVNDHYHRRF